MASSLRSLQLDAEELDCDLIEVCMEQWGKVGDRLDTDIKASELHLRAALASIFWWFSFRDNLRTIAQDLVGAQYAPDDRKNLSFCRKLLHFCTQIIFPWLCGVTGVVERSPRLSATGELILLAHFFLFLREGKFRSLTERTLSLRTELLQPETAFVDSLRTTNLELLWHGFADIMVATAPLINWKWVLGRLKQNLFGSWTSVRLPTSQYICLNCSESLVLAQQQDCTHPVCYFCAFVSKCCPLCQTSTKFGPTPLWTPIHK